MFFKFQGLAEPIDSSGTKLESNTVHGKTDIFTFIYFPGYFSISKLGLLPAMFVRGVVICLSLC